MRLFDAIHPDGSTEQYPAYTVDEVDLYSIDWDASVKLNKKQYGFALPITFDIETTNYIEVDRPLAFMYHWQMCIHGTCVYGRRWEEWISLMESLSKISREFKCIHVNYIHNLGFEFAFLRQILPKFGEVEIFAPQPRKPLTVRVCDLFEFRCSWKLSNMTLNKFTITERGCRYIKADGDLDYSKYRTPETELNDTEFSYCMSDVLSLYSGIMAKMENEGDNLGTIPLTSTSYVRRECRSACLADRRYKSAFKRMKMSPAVYELLKEAGRGGDTSANRYLAGQEISNVDSFDVKSSYPFQQLTQEFPMGRFYKHRELIDEECLSRMSKDKCLLFRCHIYRLKVKADAVDVYLPYSKAVGEVVKPRIANGRLMEAESCSYTFTEIDWQIFKLCYDYEAVAISDLYSAKKGMLPKPLRDTILSYFVKKCELEIERGKYEKGSEEYENYNYQYNKSKNRLNGIFGMCYTDVVHDIITLDLYTGEWTKDREDAKEALDAYYDGYNNFLIYAWGVWTTAHARNHLQKLIRIIGEESIYWDTDSDKGNVSRETLHQIHLANQEIVKLCLEKGAYAKVDGRYFYLGIYEHDGHYQTFKTLGAKKYAYTDDSGKLHCTISGVAKSSNPNKPDGAREMASMSNFNAGFVFREAGGTTLYYNDDYKFRERVINGCRMLSGANVAIMDSEYTLGITKEYAEIIGYNSYLDSPQDC